MRHILLYLLSCLLVEAVAGQKNRSVIWNSLQFPVQLTKQWHIQNDISYRTLGISVHSWQYTFRTGLRYFFHQKFSVAAGVAHFSTRRSPDKTENEFGKEIRLWQEAVYQDKVYSTWDWQHRLRIEERHFYPIFTSGVSNAVRIRYRINFIKSFSEKWKWNVSNEIMEQIVKNTISFQQNRLGTSFSYNLPGLSQLQFGYIWSKLENESVHYMTIGYQKTFIVYGQRN